MRQPKLIDYILLTVLALIWASAFFNIKIATYSFGPVTIAFLRVFFGAIPVLLLCYYKNIKIEAFSKDWHWFAMIGFINLVAPFFLIAYGVKSVQSNLAAILMSTTPLSSTVLGHFYTKNEKDISFEGSGCAISMASASIMTDLIKGKNEHEAKEIVEDFLGMIKENPELKSEYLNEDEKTKLMCLSGVKQYPMRVKCATLSWHTLVSAFDDKKEEVKTEN